MYTSRSRSFSLRFSLLVKTGKSEKFVPWARNMCTVKWDEFWHFLPSVYWLNEGQVLNIFILWQNTASFGVLIVSSLLLESRGGIVSPVVKFKKVRMSSRKSFYINPQSSLSLQSRSKHQFREANMKLFLKIGRTIGIGISLVTGFEYCIVCTTSLVWGFYIPMSQCKNTKCAYYKVRWIPYKYHRV